MAEGQLRCAGSSLFLKKMYGVGYQLTIEKKSRGNGNMIESVSKPTNGVKIDDDSEVLTEPASDPQKRVVYDVDEYLDDNVASSSHGAPASFLKTLVTTSVPEATLLNDVGTEVRYQLPIRSSDKFSAMFEKLDREVDAGTIVSYGVSITTLGKLN